MHPLPVCHLEANLCHGHFFAEHQSLSPADFFPATILSPPPFDTFLSRVTPSQVHLCPPAEIRQRFHLPAKKDFISRQKRFHLLAKKISSPRKQILSPKKRFNLLEKRFFIIEKRFHLLVKDFICQQKKFHFKWLSTLCSSPKVEQWQVRCSPPPSFAHQGSIQIKCKDWYLLYWSNSSCQTYTTASAGEQRKIVSKVQGQEKEVRLG